MKNIYIYIITILVATLSFGCEELLEETPVSYYTSDTFYKNTDHSNMAVLGIYDILAKKETYGMYISLNYPMDSDISQMSGLQLTSDKRIISHYAATPSRPYLFSTWRTLYNGVERANVAIKAIPEMEVYKNGLVVTTNPDNDEVTETKNKDRTTLDRHLAEAHFLRAFFYFDLVRLWGDVPLKLNPSEFTDNHHLSRTDRELVYDQIIKDLEFAAKSIPNVSEKSIDERVSKGAVLGILTRVYMYRAGYSLRANHKMERPTNYLDYYQKAAETAKLVIDSNEHQLNSDFGKIFKNYHRYTLEPKESMFEVGFFSINGEGGAGTIGTWGACVKQDGKNSFARAQAYTLVTKSFYDSFETNDFRRDTSVVTFEIKKGVFKSYGSKYEKYTPGKYRRYWIAEDPKNPNNTDINWTVLRYSDVLLMYAEALNEVNNGPSVDAFSAINKVRSRVNLSNLNTGLTYDGFKKAIISERAHELCFEGLRKFDLIRWNLLGSYLRKTQAELKAMKSKYPYVAGTNFVDNKHELFPIPQLERDENPNLTQNPKY